MKKKKNPKLNIVKCKDLRVYKDNARPTIFEDKKHKKKPKYKQDYRNWEGLD